MKRTPPFRGGLDPLIRAGLIECPLSLESDEFLRFLVFCEMTFRENLALKAGLKRCKVDPEKYLQSLEFPLGSPGRHRTIFDGWYVQLAKVLPVRLSKPGRKQQG